MNEIKKKYEDEIDLINILKVVWRWKILIIAGSLICGSISGISSYATWKNKPKRYKTTMILEPKSSIAYSNGKKEYDLSIEYLQFLVDELLQSETLKGNENSIGNESEALWNVETSIPKRLDLMIISCESNEPEVGVDMLKQITNKVSEKVKKEMGILRNDKIEEKKRTLENDEAEKEKYKKQISIISDRINDLRSKLIKVENNKKELIQQKENILSQKNIQDKTFSSLFFSNTIDQNLDLEGQYRKDIYQCLLEKEDIEFKLNAKLNSIKNLQSEIEELGFQNKGLAVQIVKPPVAKLIPRKNKTKINVILGSFTGLFIMILIVFLVEYIKKAHYHNN
jgi:uncharacterized protein involved in exopolysaccharide biosynthesis